MRSIFLRRLLLALIITLLIASAAMVGGYVFLSRDTYTQIKLQEMAFYGHHGIDSEENTLGQRFFIDVEMDLDLSGAGESDNIEDSVNYAEVFSLVQSIAEGTPCKLLERVAGKINEEILIRYSKVEEVATTVHKPSVPIHGILKDVSVTLHKKR